MGLAVKPAPGAGSREAPPGAAGAALPPPSASKAVRPLAAGVVRQLTPPKALQGEGSKGGLRVIMACEPWRLVRPRACAPRRGRERWGRRLR